MIRSVAVPCFLAILAVGPLACQGQTTAPAPTPAALEIVAGHAQVGLAGVPLPDSVVVRLLDEDGAPLAGQTVRWDAPGTSHVSPAAVTTDDAGLARGLWVLTDRPGPDTVFARAGDVTIAVVATAESAEPGVVYTGRNGYVTYAAGDLPVVLSAPHGGTLEPEEIPDRATGTMVRDVNTELLATALADALEARFGARPHLVIDHLHRRKMDANRDLEEATAGHPLAEHAWLEFQRFIDHARERVTAGHGAGLYLDIHGHGHEIQRLELGYLLDDEALALSDDALTTLGYASRSSIRALAAASDSAFPALLRGPVSLGALLEAEGIPAVPSVSQPDPGLAPYFSGGYNTRRHGSRDGGTIDGIQIETHRTGIRDTEASRARFGEAAARAIERFLATHYPETVEAAPAR